MDMYTTIMKALDFQIKEPLICAIKEVEGQSDDRLLKKSFEEAAKYNISNIMKHITTYYTDFNTFQNEIFEKIDLTPLSTNTYLELGDVYNLLQLFDLSDPEDKKLEGLATKIGVQILYEPMINRASDKYSIDLFNTYHLKWGLDIRIFILTSVKNASFEVPICVKHIDLTIDDRGDAMFLGVMRNDIKKISDIETINRSCKAVNRISHMIIRSRESLMDPRVLSFSSGMAALETSGENMDSMLRLILVIVVMGITAINSKEAEIIQRSNSDGLSAKTLRKRIRHDGFKPVTYNDVIFNIQRENNDTTPEDGADEICGICNNVSGCSCLRDGYR